MSDDLLGRADSLMRRSRSFVAGHAAPAPVDDGIPLLTEAIDLDALIAVPEPEDRTAEITAQVTADVTERVTAEVTAAVTERVTADVTARVTAEVTAAVTADVTQQVTAQVAQQVTRDVTERVTQEVAAQTRLDLLDEARHAVRAEINAELRDALQQNTSYALTQQFGDLAPLIQSLIDDWSRTTLPALVGLELRAALEAAMGAAVENATARIREQAVLDLRDTIAGEIEARSVAVVTAALSRDPSEAPDQPL
ncbi:hypothetical protein [Methyloversatilis sp.]|uniref:hypothetical protein n=1 Tax=Methyloversatilis sp. TaxID=2569862 RepID=UPI002735F73B|nr:hypothetical protein [Methyloversatilis sp.]MDP2868285.1 hypothetical protein [Methyloversatilis sp.]MDP3454321.1 hypothetical protein [Methyloversatilis sp.]MDP3577892.1 hypothetical protein [Methyloversatilis sp.]